MREFWLILVETFVILDQHLINPISEFRKIILFEVGEDGSDGLGRDGGGVLTGVLEVEGLVDWGEQLGLDFEPALVLLEGFFELELLFFDGRSPYFLVDVSLLLFSCFARHF